MNFKSIFKTQADNQIIIKIITIVIIIITVIISDVFLVQLGLHQGSLLGPLSFVIMLEILLRKIRSGCSGKLPQADHSALVSETLEGLKKVWRLRKKYGSQNG